MSYLRILLMWLLFLPVPIINGLLREKWYKVLVGELGAHWIGVFIISSFFLLYVFLFFKNSLSSLNNHQLLIMGSVWLVLTIVFEFGIGIAGGRSWSYMLADYNILAGRVWPLVLFIVFFSPFIIKKLTRFLS